VECPVGANSGMITDKLRCGCRIVPFQDGDRCGINPRPSAGIRRHGVSEWVTLGTPKPQRVGAGRLKNGPVDFGVIQLSVFLSRSRQAIVYVR
jgi:hypothetical protein